MADSPEAAVRIAVLNGPNLNLLGTREPGDLRLDDALLEIEGQVREVASWSWGSNLRSPSSIMKAIS